MLSSPAEFLDDSFFRLVFRFTPEDEDVLFADDLGSKRKIVLKVT